MTVVIRCVFRNFGKALLNSLSIGIGVFAVLLINGLSNYAIAAADRSLDSMGINGYIVSGAAIYESDIERLRECDRVACAAPIISAAGTVEDNKVTLVGTDENLAGIYAVTMESGSFIDSKDVSAGAAECVISNRASRRFFGCDDATGMTITVNVKGKTQRLTVKGIYTVDSMVSKYSSPSTKETIYMPYSSVGAMCGCGIVSVAVSSVDGESAAGTCAYIDAYCRQIFGESYEIDNAAADREKISSLMWLIRLILDLIGGVSVLVSVTGLMVIMIINVRSRKTEIGLKKSLGAQDSSILREVVCESGLIAVIGVAVGTALYFIAKAALSLWGIIASANLFAYFIIAAVSLVSALLFGLIPAAAAAHTDPVIALKSQ